MAVRGDLRVMVVLTAALGVGGTLGLVYLLQDSLLFFPQPLIGPGPSPDGRIEEVRLDVDDGVRLHGWLVQGRKRPSPLVLYFGGNAEEVSWLVGSACLPVDWSLLLVNYRGYGRSTGRPSERALFRDALRVYDYAASHADVDGGRIVAMGRSLGSGVAIYLATERPLRGLVLVTPFDSIAAVGQRHYPFLPVRWLLRHPFDSLSRAPAIHAPMISLAAGRDAVIPPVHAARLYERWAGPKRWREFPTADHDSISAEPEFWTMIAAFLRELEAVA